MRGVLVFLWCLRLWCWVLSLFWKVEDHWFLLALFIFLYECFQRFFLCLWACFIDCSIMTMVRLKARLCLHLIFLCSRDRAQIIFTSPTGKVAICYASLWSNRRSRSRYWIWNRRGKLLSIYGRHHFTCGRAFIRLNSASLFSRLFGCLRPV